MAKRGNNSLGRRAYGGKPYDANNSFVKKMATKVTDLIPQRSWISKWFNTSQDNGDASNDEGQSADGEEETQQPPAKRPRIRADVSHPSSIFSLEDKESSSNHDTAASNQTEEYFLEPSVAGPSGVCKLVSSTPALNADSRDAAPQRAQSRSQIATTNNGATNGTDDNSESGESTSCCSSLIPHTSRQEGAPNSAYGANTMGARNRFIDDKSSFTNHLQSPRCLFLASGGSRDSLSSRRPSFNPSIVSNNSNNLERSTSLSSPFYSGNVTFGGANAVGSYKRGRSLFNSTNEFQLKVPRRTSVQVKPSSAESVDASGMSQTAKRILEAMEYFSSPISDAKKIPVKKLTDTSVGTKRSRDEGSPSTRVGLRHLTRELAVPTVPEMLKLRRRQKLQDTTVAARKIISAMSGQATSSSRPTTTTTITSTTMTTTLSADVTSETANDEYRLRTELDPNPKYHGKLRAKLKKNPEEEGPAPSVNLPSISLEITSLPSFEPLPKYTAPPIVTSRKDDKAKEDLPCGYKFANPIKITEASWNLKSINNFSFSKPIDANETVTTTAKLVSNKLDKETANLTNETVPMNFVWSGSSTAPRLKLKAKQSDADNTTSEKRPTFDNAAVKELVKLKSGGTLASRATFNDRGSRNEIWECSECYIKNDSHENNCVACKTPKSRATGSNDTSKRSNAISNDTRPTVTAQKNISDSSFGAQFKMSANQWECESCLVRNPTSSIKCASCSSTRPNGSANKSENNLANVSRTPAINDLAVKFKPAEGSWECCGCMLRNPSSVITCPCCSASKPSLSKVNAKQKNQDAASVDAASIDSVARETPNKTLMDKFKPSSSSWECSSCLVRNSEAAITCVCCSSSKPGDATSKSVKETEPRIVSESGWGDKFKKPEGSWSCDSCMLQNKSEATECVACNTAKPGCAAAKSQPASSTPFTFGIPANEQTFKFGIDKAEMKPAWNSSGESAKAGFFCPNSMQSKVEPGQFKFGIPKESDKEVTAASTSTSGGFVFASPKTATDKTPTSASKTSDEATKSVDSAKSNSMPFVFGMPKSVNKQPETSAEETRKEITAMPGKGNGDKPLFVFGLPKTEQNATSENKLSFGAAPSAKVTIFGNQSQTTNETNATPKTATSETQSDKPVTSTIASPSTSIAAPFRAPFTFTSSFGQTAAPPSNFSLGANASATETSTNDNANKTVSPTFGMSSSTSPSRVFGTVASSVGTTETATTSEANKTCFAPTETPKSTFFGITGDKSSPAFGATVEKKTSVFGNTDNKLPSIFGSNEKPAIATTTTSNAMFNSVPSSSPAATFGAPATPTQSIFGNAATSVFGGNPSAPSFGSANNVGTSSIFATATKASVAPNTANNSGLFSFGGTNTQQITGQSTPSTFTFSSDTGDNANPSAKPIFGFGSTGASVQTNANECFGATATNAGTFGTVPTTVTNPTPSPFNFNSPSNKQEPPAFGQSSASLPSMFGTQPNQSSSIGQQTTASTFAANAAPSTGFNFRPAAPATGGFNFTAGMAQAPATPSGGFTFNAPAPTPPIAFDPNTPPSFNFTGGTAPTAFNAAPQPFPPRKIKKAVRRMQQR